MKLIKRFDGFRKRDKVERVGFPTQKPIGLYARMIRSSTDENAVVLDPFAGCATTCIAAERLNRRWVGIDIWEKAPEVVVERMNKVGLFAPKNTRRTQKNMQTYLFAEDFHFTSTIPTRTDDNEPAVPHLRVKVRIKEPSGRKMSRAEMYEHLLARILHKKDGKASVIRYNSVT